VIRPPSVFNELTGRESDSEVKARSQRSDLQGVSLIYGHKTAADKDVAIFTPGARRRACRYEHFTR